MPPSALGDVQNIHDLEKIQNKKISFSLMKVSVKLTDEFPSWLQKKFIILKAVQVSRECFSAYHTLQMYY